MKTPASRTRSRAPRRLLAAMGAVMVVGLAACDRSPTASEDEHGEPVAAQVFDRASGELLAYTHGTGAGIHWDGSIPHLEVGEEIALNVVFLDEDDRPIPLGGEFEVRARLATGAPSGVVELSDHGDHIDVEAVGPGQTQIVFMLWHGGHSDWDSPALTINVEVEGGEPVAALLRDRDSGEVYAETHGSGPGIHWDGALPVLTVGEELELDLVFLDAAGEEIVLGGEYEGRLALAEGAAEGVISWANHVDHVDIDAEAAGTTEVVIQFWHDDHVDWETPAIEVKVDVDVATGEPVAALLRDRDSGEVYAETHGTGEGIHWDGELPVLTVGEELELDLVFLNAAGEEIALGGEYEGRLALAEGAAEGVISWANHVDHVDIDAEAAGTTEVLIQFWHDDHVDWETPAIEVTVVDP